MTLHLLTYKYSEYACFLAFFGLFVSLVQVFEVSIDWCGVFRNSSWRRCVFLFSCLWRNRCRLRAAAAGLFLFLFCNDADRSATSSSSYSSKGLHIGVEGAESPFPQPQSRMGELVLHSKLSSAFNSSSSSLLTKHGEGDTSLSTTKPSSLQSRELFPSSRARGTSMNSHLEGHLPSAKECNLNLRSHLNHQFFMVRFHGFQDK